MMGTTTGRLSQIPGRPDRKKPMNPPKGSVIYWNESGELMLEMPEKPKPCWHKEPIDPRFPNSGSHICGKAEHTDEHTCLSCGSTF